jgi:hypothetical protein
VTITAPWLRIVAAVAIAAAILTAGLLIGAADSLNALGFGVLLVGMVLIGEGYFLIWRAQIIHGQGEQLLGAAARLLALVPGKSAARTDGSDEQPRTWWEALKALPAVEVERCAHGPNFDGYCDTCGVPTDARPDPGPKTEPIVMPPVVIQLDADGRGQAEIPVWPAPKTVPMAAAIDDDWQRQSEALYQQMLAEIRGETVKEGER